MLFCAALCYAVPRCCHACCVRAGLQEGINAKVVHLSEALQAPVSSAPFPRTSCSLCSTLWCHL